MSKTMRYRPWTEPGAAEVISLPKMIEHSEPGGVNCVCDVDRAKSFCGAAGFRMDIDHLAGEDYRAHCGCFLPSRS
jgi:hypothetical protein